MDIGISAEEGNTVLNVNSHELSQLNPLNLTSGLGNTLNGIDTSILRELNTAITKECQAKKGRESLNIETSELDHSATGNGNISDR